MKQHVFNMMINSYNPTKWRWVGRWGKFIEAVAVKDPVISYNSLSVYSLSTSSLVERPRKQQHAAHISAVKIFNAKLRYAYFWKGSGACSESEAVFSINIAIKNIAVYHFLSGTVKCQKAAKLEVPRNYLNSVLRNRKPPRSE